MTAQYGGAKPLGRKVHILNPNSQGGLAPTPLLQEQIQLRYKNIYVIFCDDKGILKYYFSGCIGLFCALASFNLPLFSSCYHSDKCLQPQFTQSELQQLRRGLIVKTTRTESPAVLRAAGCLRGRGAERDSHTTTWKESIMHSGWDEDLNTAA